MFVRSVRARTGRAGRTLAVVGVLVGVSVVGLSTPALANSGKWCNNVGMWVNWSASKTSTKIEPHEMSVANAGIGRYTGSGVVYYYGPGVTNLPNEHHTSYISATNGTYVGNYFRVNGVRYTLPDPNFTC
jgi:hypothetical protein